MSIMKVARDDEDTEGNRSVSKVLIIDILLSLKESYESQCVLKINPKTLPTSASYNLIFTQLFMLTFFVTLHF